MTANGSTSRAPALLTTIPDPTITKLPDIPTKVRTEQVIEGINFASNP